MTCPNCGAAIDGRSLYCNYCGAAQEPPPREHPSPEDPFAPEGPQIYVQQPPPPSRGIGEALGGKGNLILSICCFAWALVKGLPRLFDFLGNLFSRIGHWGNMFGMIGGTFSLALHLALPLALGILFLRRHQNQGLQG